MQPHRHLFTSSLLLVAAHLLAGAATAQSVGGGLRLGTPAIGLDVESLVTERFGIRGAVSDRPASYDYDNSGIRYDDRFLLGTGFFIADWHPYASGFRLSGGLAYGTQRYVGMTRPGGVNMNATDYPTAQMDPLDARGSFAKASPYLGVGWGLVPRPGSRLYFSADLGLMYQRPSTSLTGMCGSALPASVCAQLHGDIREEPEFREAADHMRLYPVISVGFGLRF